MIWEYKYVCIKNTFSFLWIFTFKLIQGSQLFLLIILSSNSTASSFYIKILFNSYLFIASSWNNYPNKTRIKAYRKIKDFYYALNV